MCRCHSASPGGLFCLPGFTMCIAQLLQSIAHCIQYVACRYCGCEAGAGDARFHVNIAI
ncbi:hypothetical protein PR003_g2598 [Phytophthora rubi]|uniref:Uncharacterized protein n=1 Tax=Phytophthora rubi TaxID=129364 RepID=A0A6A3NN76_9STRA|nr:hypothetical protein PR002_g2531 [Phytophthora rubi]KAE9047262.1 hypothetical protein PR001_g4277 [Phytophthora rubi]KAE9355897.1 hypothetical protein PR003_g2598 [Phytophthora rubi]